MTNNYCTSTDAFADMSEGNYSSSDFPEMEGFVTSASRLIDAQFGVEPGFFYPTTDSVSRYYDGSGCDEQDIDPFASISEVAVAEQGGTESTDYTAWSSSDWIASPYNYTSRHRPITKLVIDPNGNKIGFNRFRKSVRITGIPGWSTSTPELIASAARRQSIRWFMQAKQAYQDMGMSVSAVGLKFSKSEFDKDVQQMLRPFLLELSE